MTFKEGLGFKQPKKKKTTQKNQKPKNNKKTNERQKKKCLFQRLIRAKHSMISWDLQHAKVGCYLTLRMRGNGDHFWDVVFLDLECESHLLRNKNPPSICNIFFFRYADQVFLDLSLSWLAEQFSTFCPSCWDLFNCEFRGLAPCGSVTKLDLHLFLPQGLETIPLPFNGAKSSHPCETAFSLARDVDPGFQSGISWQWGSGWLALWS